MAEKLSEQRRRNLESRTLENTEGGDLAESFQEVQERIAQEAMKNLPPSEKFFGPGELPRDLDLN